MGEAEFKWITRSEHAKYSYIDSDVGSKVVTQMLLRSLARRAGETARKLRNCTHKDFIVHSWQWGLGLL